MPSTLRFFTMMFCTLLFLPPSAQAGGLGGDWGGARGQLESSGLSLEAVYSGEFVRNLDPGLVQPRKDTIYHDNLDLTATLDTEAAGWWTGGTFFLYGLYNHGGFPSASVIGDLQTASNIEASRNQFIVHEAWYEHRLGGGVSLLAGLHDLNSEFNASEYGSLFINSSSGIDPSISANVPTSLFPKAGLGLRMKFAPGDAWYVQAAVYDGDPATRSISKTEGGMSIVEAGTHLPGDGSYKLGAWLHSADKIFAGQRYNNDYGIYALADQPLYSFSAGTEVSAFMQFGWVPRKRNEITRYYGAGLHLAGLIPRRPDDEAGVAVSNAYTRSGTEHAVELTWRLALTDGLSVQPDMQWIFNSGGNAAASSIRVAMLRFELTL
ncbi:MAG: carbohydrate porin [Mariprofundaceae bacterium]|nr:carbohydrate porin [Mariprofundaceae bacterium]